MSNTSLMEYITSTEYTTTTTSGFVYSNDITAVIILITAILTVGCILGNSLVILAVLLTHKLKTQTSNYLIVSLAISDILVGIGVMPLAIIYEVLGIWPFGMEICSLWVTLDVTLSTSSILNLMMISIDRYLIITIPFKYERHRTVLLMMGFIAIAWIVSLAVSTLPLMVGWHPELGPEKTFCQVNQKLEYQMYATFGAFYIPLTVMLALYGRIYLISRKFRIAEKKNNPRPLNNNNDEQSETGSEKIPLNTRRNGSVEHSVIQNPNIVLPVDQNLINETILEVSHDTTSVNETEYMNYESHTQHHNHLQVETNGHHQHRMSLKKLSIATIASIKKFLHRNSHKGHTQAIRTLGVIMGLFTACWLPFFVLAVVAPMCAEKCDIPKWIWGFLTWLGYANSCFNPIIYARFNREFRTPFKEILCFRCHKINESVRHTDYLDKYGSSS